MLPAGSFWECKVWCKRRANECMRMTPAALANSIRPVEKPSVLFWLIGGVSFAILRRVENISSIASRNFRRACRRRC